MFPQHPRASLQQMGGRGPMAMAAKVRPGISKGRSCVAQDEDQHGREPYQGYHAAKEGKVGSRDLSQMKTMNRSRKSPKAMAETACNQTMSGVTAGKNLQINLHIHQITRRYRISISAFHQVYEAFCAVGPGQRQIVNVAPDKRRVHVDES